MRIFFGILFCFSSLSSANALTDSASVSQEILSTWLPIGIYSGETPAGDPCTVSVFSVGDDLVGVSVDGESVSLSEILNPLDSYYSAYYDDFFMLGIRYQSEPDVEYWLEMKRYDNGITVSAGRRFEGENSYLCFIPKSSSQKK